MFGTYSSPQHKPQSASNSFLTQADSRPAFSLKRPAAGHSGNGHCLRVAGTIAQYLANCVLNSYADVSSTYCGTRSAVCSALPGSAVESLATDPRYSLIAVCSAQHLRAVASRLEIRGPDAPALTYDTLYWRRREWLDFLSPLSSDAQKLFQAGASIPFPNDSGALDDWLRRDRKQVLRHHAVGRLRLLAGVVELSWGLAEQHPRWRKRATNSLKGYAYNVAQMMAMYATEVCRPEENESVTLDLLTTSALPEVRRWIEAREQSGKLKFVLASAHISNVWKTPWRRLVEVSLETASGVHVADRFEMSRKTGLPGDHGGPQRLPRVHPFIGYV